MYLGKYLYKVNTKLLKLIIKHISLNNVIHSCMKHRPLNTILDTLYLENNIKEQLDKEFFYKDINYMHEYEFNAYTTLLELGIKIPDYRKFRK